MTIRFHSPMPPARSGVADYSAALVDALRARVEVVVNPPGSGHGVDLYHAGNNALHGAIYRRAIEQPGVVVLHDATLQHLLLGSMDERHYIEEFVSNYGEWYRGLGETLWRERGRSAGDRRYFEYPMLKRLAKAARAVVVHNAAAAKIVLRHVPEAHVVEIPHLLIPPPAVDTVEMTRLRLSMSLTPDAFLCGVFGHLRETKRLPSILRVFAKLRERDPRFHLLVAGEFASTDLERAVMPELTRPGVIRRGYLSDADLWLHAASIDACINLKWPSAAETSGIGVRLMGLGQPVLFTAGDEIARLPAGSCLPIEPGAAEEEHLAATLLWLAGDRAQARAVGRRAREHVLREHAAGAVALRYEEVLEDAVMPAR